MSERVASKDAVEDKVHVLLARWRCIARAAILMYRVSQGLKQYAHIASLDYDSLKVQIVTRTNDSNHLSFDANDFLYDKEFRWPKGFLKHVTKPPELRTDGDICVIKKLLRPLPGFRQLTTTLQMKICRLIRYLKLGRHRILVREGHRPCALFLLFSGRVTESREDRISYPETRALTRGHWIGEVELALDVRRISTVATDSVTEILFLTSDDVTHIKLLDFLQEKYNYLWRLLRSSEFLYYWSDEAVRALVTNGHLVQHCPVERVLDNSLKKTQWIWFVYEGTCEVVKRIRESRLPVDIRNDLYRTSNSITSLAKHSARKRMMSSWSLEKQRKHIQFISGSFDKIAGSRQVTEHRYNHLMSKQFIEPYVESCDSYVASSVSSSDSDCADTVFEVEAVQLENEGLDILSERNTYGTRRTSCAQSSNVATLAKKNTESLSGIHRFSVDRLGAGQFITFGDLHKFQEDLQLVSKGCSVICIPWSVFKKRASPADLKPLNNYVLNLPKEVDLCEQYILEENWKGWKANIILTSVFPRNFLLLDANTDISTKIRHKIDTHRTFNTPIMTSAMAIANDKFSHKHYSDIHLPSEAGYYSRSPDNDSRGKKIDECKSSCDVESRRPLDIRQKVEKALLRCRSRAGQTNRSGNNVVVDHICTSRVSSSPLSSIHNRRVHGSQFRSRHSSCSTRLEREKHRQKFATSDCSSSLQQRSLTFITRVDSSLTGVKHVLAMLPDTI